MGDVTTKTRTDQKPAPSVSKSGHWRNKWWCAQWHDPASGNPKGETLSKTPWKTREAAEAKAAQQLAVHDEYRRSVPEAADWQPVLYLGPQFFPDP